MTPLTLDQASAFRRNALDAIDIVPALGAFLKLEYLLQRSFCSAIFEGDFRDANSAVTNACMRRNIKDLYCASLTQDALPSFSFEVSHESLRAVRELYHVPSYVISDNFHSIIIVSDSDYYWGIGAPFDIVSEVVVSAADLQQNEEDIRPYLESSDAHDKRLGAMLEAFHDVCRRSCEAATSRRG